jgi:hypothetical protein
MNLKELQKSVGQRVIAEHKGIQIVGKLINFRRMFGRDEGQVEWPKGSRPASKWYWAEKIKPI